MLALYDPNGGFATGGRINSLAVNYKIETAVAGKATISFVLKYQKGAVISTGKTGFHSTGIRFSSSGYRWLVVNQAGGKSQLKGKGTVAGRPGGHRFMA